MMCALFLIFFTQSGIHVHCTQDYCAPNDCMSRNILLQVSVIINHYLPNQSFFPRLTFEVQEHQFHMGGLLQPNDEQKTNKQPPIDFIESCPSKPTGQLR